MFQLPEDILRLIFIYDDTYRIIFNKCIQELNYHISNIRIITSRQTKYWKKYKLYNTDIVMYDHFFNNYKFYKLMLGNFYKRNNVISHF